jgi:hypothetical protein
MLLWHTGSVLSGHDIPYNRNQIDILFVQVDNLYLTKVDSLDALKAWSTGNKGAYWQNGNWLYIRVREKFVSAPVADSMPWFFNVNIVASNVGLTSGEFIVINNTGYNTGLLSTYKLKLSADNRTYSQIKFENQSIDIIKSAIDNSVIEEILGGSITFNVLNNGVLTKFDRYLVDNIVTKLDSYSLKLKDVRSAMKNTVINQKFTTFYGGNLTSTNRNNHTSEDVQKLDVADAIGYCYGVPGVCINDYAFDSDEYRYYRYCYNSFSPEKVEVEVEKGWLAITNYAIASISETLPTGEVITTNVLKVPVGVVVPPVTGTPEPDYDIQPRTVRVTGTFHTEIANITRPEMILRYIIERYTFFAYNSESFNMSEIANELAPLNSAPIGIYIDRPIEVYKVIAQLQTGSIRGFKFCTYRSLFTCRLHNPNRAIALSISQYEIKNLFSLEVDYNGDDYISDGYVRYAKNYSEDTMSEYRDEYTRETIVAVRGSDSAGGVETLLKNWADAVTRYTNFMEDSLYPKLSVRSIKLVEKRFPEFMNLREYDIVNIDLSPLTNKKVWYIMKVEIDFALNTVMIDVLSK